MTNINLAEAKNTEADDSLENASGLRRCSTHTSTEVQVLRGKMDELGMRHRIHIVNLSEVS